MATCIDSTRPKTGFMDLPVEIRLDIYNYLLEMPAYSRRRSPDAHIYPNLLLANKQINWEATDLLYSSNTFLAHPTLLASFPRLRSWYDPVKESSVLPRIRKFHVDVRLDCDLPYEKDAVTQAFSGLDELTININQAMYLGVGHGNLAKFEGIRGVKKVEFTGSTTGFDDYIKWLKAAMMSQPEDKVEDFVQETSGWAGRLSTIHCFF